MKIGALSKQLNLGIHTIRYYEKRGLINKPVKDASGHRLYDADDADLLGWIACMKNSGMPLSKIKMYTEALTNKNNLQRLALLEEHYEKLQVQKRDINHYLEVTNEKIKSLKNT